MISVAGLRRAVRRETIGVDVGAALNLVGALIKYLSLAFLFPVPFALGYGESPWPFLAAGALAAGTGLLLERLTRGKERVGSREGFLVVAVTWLAAAFFGSLPYLFSGEDQFARPVNAFFEGMSGFTTTGASVLTDIEALPQALLMWRQFTQWLGGMGIIVLALAVLPRLRIGGRQLFESEVPGSEMERLAASIRETARRLWILYLALTAALVVLLAAYGLTGLDKVMTPFDALAHALTTMPTGGFSPRAESLGAFGPATQWTVIVFMLVGGTNFALLYAVLVRRRLRALTRDDEFRLYVALAVVASVVLFAELAAKGIFEGEAALRHAAFQAVSLMTTTGYASADYVQWTTLAAVGLVGLMFIGGSAGSTAGSVKVVRHLLIGKILRRELDLTVHPEIISPIRFSGRAVEEKTTRAVIAFVLLYVGLFAVGVLLITIDAAVGNREVTPFEAIAASATAIGNVGPGYGFAGPFGSFEPFSGFSKAVLMALMWMGRLEIITVTVLFTRRYWRT
jgi:trk system potassium uptake protein TrkH